MNTQTTMTHKRAQLLLGLLVVLVLVLGLIVEAQPQPLDGSPTRQRAPLIGLRFRRQAASILHANNNNNKDQLMDQVLEQGDEQALRRHLPDLIAQAHNDKQVERALLRMLIQASLRSTGNQQQQQLAGNNNWQLDGLADEGNNLAQYDQANTGSVGEFVPIRLARFQSSPSQSQDREQQNGQNSADLASQLEAQLANVREFETPLIVPNSVQQQSYPMDKREYIKPCSFNAISCVRTPFGRRIK